MGKNNLHYNIVLEMYDGQFFSNFPFELLSNNELKLLEKFIITTSHFELFKRGIYNDDLIN